MVCNNDKNDTTIHLARELNHCSNYYGMKEQSILGLLYDRKLVKIGAYSGGP